MRVRVAVEALTGRGAAEVRVAEKSRLPRRVTQAVFCLYVCARRDDTRENKGGQLVRLNEPETTNGHKQLSDFYLQGQISLALWAHYSLVHIYLGQLHFQGF